MNLFELPSDLDTPELVVDVDRLDRNIARMAADANAQGVVLRPHAKTHKSVEIALRQLGAGAPGITVAVVDLAATTLIVSGGEIVGRWAVDAHNRSG